MARRVYFKVRSKKRTQRKRKLGKIVLIMLVMGALVVGVPRILPQPVAPVMAGEAKQSEAKPYWGPALYLRILAKVIPGFSESIPAELASGQGKLMEGPVKTLSFIDPRDPKNILAAQIPYMVDAGVQLQPLIIQDNTNERTNQEPKIVKPLRHTLTGEGKVAIYHVHTTESFVPTSGERFTEQLDVTVTKLGATLMDILQNEYDLPVVHNQTIHDIPRNKAYETALPTIQTMLEANPDTELVIDLHRDGVARSVTTFELNDKAVGKILFVVGTRHPNWEENYEKALYLHEKLEEIAPGISRGIRERPLMYNQHIHPGAILIEVGGHENSLDEAMEAIPFLAHALADLYKSGL